MKQTTLSEYNSGFWRKPTREQILSEVERLFDMHRKGLLGGETMPEDSNPGLSEGSAVNYHYFTLPMSLNYQRDSYALWRSALRMYEDPDARAGFSPDAVADMDSADLKKLLTKNGVAIQPDKQTGIWQTICHTICEHLDGDIRNLFIRENNHIPDVLEYVQKTRKRDFPYLSGPKICHYWLYVISRYTDADLTGREALNVAPDTHVIRATIHIGLVSPDLHDHSRIQSIVNDAWKDVLAGTGILPIDIHTPLWLWSRSSFKSEYT